MSKPAATGQLSPTLRLLAQVGNRLARVLGIHPPSVPDSLGRANEVTQLESIFGYLNGFNGRIAARHRGNHGNHGSGHDESGRPVRARFLRSARPQAGATKMGACLPARQPLCASPPLPTSTAPPPHRRMTDHYTALGLGSSATLADIKKAFRQKASQYHPDRNSDANAPERFRAVQEAYEVLTDDAKRQAYDDNRRRNLLDDPAQTAREIWQAYFEPLRQIAR